MSYLCCSGIDATKEILSGSRIEQCGMSEFGCFGNVEIRERGRRVGEVIPDLSENRKTQL